MCDSCAEGGRRCPGSSSPKARAAHNTRRRENRTVRAAVVSWARQRDLPDLVLDVLAVAPPSVAKERAEIAGAPVARLDEQKRLKPTATGLSDAGWASAGIVDQVAAIARAQGANPDEAGLLHADVFGDEDEGVNTPADSSSRTTATPTSNRSTGPTRRPPMSTPRIPFDDPALEHRPLLDQLADGFEAKPVDSAERSEIRRGEGSVDAYPRTTAGTAATPSIAMSLLRTPTLGMMGVDGRGRCRTEESDEVHSINQCQDPVESCRWPYFKWDVINHHH